MNDVAIHTDHHVLCILFCYIEVKVEKFYIVNYKRLLGKLRFIDFNDDSLRQFQLLNLKENYRQIFLIVYTFNVFEKHLITHVTVMEDDACIDRVIKY